MVADGIQTRAFARRFFGGGGLFFSPTPNLGKLMTAELTDRDSKILSVLTNRLRVLSVEQVAKQWFAHTAAPLRQARKRVRRLVACGYLWRETVMAHRPLPLSGPTLSWQPGSHEPELGQLAYHFKRRWREALQPIDIVRATDKARQVFGGYIRGGPLRLSETSHELSLAEVFLLYRQHHPELADRWRPECELLATGYDLTSHVPDAVIPAGAGGLDLLIEFGGAYRKQKLERLHEAYRTQHYELW